MCISFLFDIDSVTKQGESKNLAAEGKDNGPERRVQKAPRLEDDDPAEKLAGDETIEEMVRRMNRELDELIEDFIAMDEHPTMAETAAIQTMTKAENATTAPAAATAVSATATRGAGRTSAEATADAKIFSIADPPPSNHHR